MRERRSLTVLSLVQATVRQVHVSGGTQQGLHGDPTNLLGPHEGDVSRIMRPGVGPATAR